MPLFVPLRLHLRRIALYTTTVAVVLALVAGDTPAFAAGKRKARRRKPAGESS